MAADVRRRGSYQLTVARPQRSRSRRSQAPGLEPLETRQLLALFTGFSHIRNIPTPGGVYSLSLTGPGVLKTSPAGRGAFDVKVLGTSSSSTLTVSQVRPRYHVVGGPLQIRNLDIRSGVIGSVDAGAAVLTGAMTPLDTSPTEIAFGGLGPNAKIDVNGSVGTIALGSVALGPAGHVVIAGDVTGTSSGNGAGTTSNAISVGQMSIDGGQFLIGRDVLAPVSVLGDIRLMRGGIFSTGRDQTGTLQVGGSIVLDTGGSIVVGRNLAGLSVNGDVLVNPSQSGIAVGGDLPFFHPNQR